MNPPLVPPLLALSVLAMASAPADAGRNSDDPLAGYRGKARVLVVVAARPDDDRLRQQRALFAAMKAGADERDLALVEAIGTSAQAGALRQRLGLRNGFQAALVGKDGGSKLVSDKPLGPVDLFPVIDAMPMRQQEIQTK